MSKSVLISINPKYCELIANGAKTIEIRKTKPKIKTPFKCYIYCTNSKEMLWLLNSAERPYNDKIASIIKAKDCGGAFKANGSVIGEFVCNDIKAFDVPYPAYSSEMDKTIIEKSCVVYCDLHRYALHNHLYAWHISDLVIYDKPRELREFRKSGALSYDDWLYGMYNGKAESSYEKYLLPFVLTRPPQSWCYVEEVEDDS